MARQITFAAPAARFPLFDRRAAPAYAIVAFTVGLGAVLVFACGFQIDAGARNAVSAATGLFLMAGLLGRRIGFDRVAGWLESLALAGLFGASCMLIFCPLTWLSGSFVDGELARADALIGFHWPDLAHWLIARPLLVDIARGAYRSFALQPPLLLGALFVSGRFDRAWHLLIAGMIGTLICAAFLPFMPAEGPVLHFGVKITGTLANSQALKAGADLHALKSGFRIIGLKGGGGFVSLPSYHAAAALMFVWAAWPTFLRWPILLLDAAMLASTIVVGNHYLVDLPAGMIVGAISLAIAGKAMRETARLNSRSVGGARRRKPLLRTEEPQARLV
jgi:membrane-associated phospholipid phosphatase